MNVELTRDVMQVCLRGHVITDMLASQPDQGVGHCHICGAPTLCSCQTCGQGIPGAASIPGMSTVGRRAAPQHCPTCGAAFPWAEQPVAQTKPETVALLEVLLRRLPGAIRQLRDRRDRRPTLKVSDIFDLEDLLRVVLHLHFDDVRRQTRTPKYAPLTRTDFVVGPDRIAITVKLVTARNSKPQLISEVHEDVAYYEGQPECSGVVVLVYDPEQLVVDPQRLEASLRSGDSFDVRCLVAIPS